MSVTSFIRELLGKGMSLEAALTAAEVYEATPPAKSAAAVRQKRYRDGKRNEASRVTTNVTETPPLPDKESSPTPPKEINPSPAAPIGAAPRSRATFDGIETKLFEAAGLSGFRTEKSPGLISLAPIIDLLDRGYDLEIDILPVIRDKCRGGFRPKTWGYFTEMVIERAAKRRAIPFKAAAASVDWDGRIEAFRSDGTWSPAWGPKPGERGCRVPTELQQRTAA